METVGFIGLGRMGSAMAGNIQKAGYPMVVHDVREAATMPLLQGGAELVSSPAEVGRRSEVIFTSLPRPEDVEAVATRPEGLLEGIREGSVYLDLSTCGPDLVRRLEPMFRQKGAHVMDAPVLAFPDKRRSCYFEHDTLGFYVTTPGNKSPVVGVKPGWGLHIEWDCAKPRRLCTLYGAVELS
jgi:3-hydroxyisobutyrate dehydrogenase-like beta-hydroxyacid dehydrogenase